MSFCFEIPVMLHDNLQLETQTLRSSYLSHTIAATTKADEYWHLHSSVYTNTLIYVQTTSRTLLQTLSEPKPGNFVKLIPLYLLSSK